MGSSRVRVGVLQGSLLRTTSVLKALFALRVDVLLRCATVCRGLTNTGLPRLSAVYLKLNDLLGLTELFVNDNTIDILAKDDLASLPNLLKFNVEMNLLKSVDRSSFTRTNKLTEINLKNNKLTVLLDSTFDDLASLKILKVSHNKLTGIAGGLFKKNAMLEVLDLAYNEFTTGISGLSSTSFQDGFGALKILRLNNNKLTSIMDTHFSKLLALDTLDLANNQLTLVADEAFNIPTAALAKLYLQNNKLASLSDKVIASIADINELYIEGTYWNCCLMGWAVNASNTKDLSSALCARPAIVKNKDLKNALAITVAKNACDQGAWLFVGSRSKKTNQKTHNQSLPPRASCTRRMYVCN